MEFTNNGMSIFYDKNYAFWNRRMILLFLQEQGFNFWQAVVDGYKEPATPPRDKDGNKIYKNN
jgi:phage/plasmid-associated DNA primase